MPRILPYKEGDFFAVPLNTGGYGIGIAVCLDAKGGVVGRFFDGIHETPPPLIDLIELTEDDSVHVEHFHHLGLIDGSWIVIGQHPTWDSYDWPIPKFGWFQPFEVKPGGRAYEMELDESLKTVRQKEVSIEHFETLPYENVSGSTATELILTTVLTRPGWKPRLPHHEWMPGNWKLSPAAEQRLKKSEAPPEPAE